MRAVPQEESVAQTLLRNSRWIIAGIYAPELVVFVAWRQWCASRLLQHLVDEMELVEHERQPRRKSTARPLQWTMAHSFFACSGGSVMEIDSLRGVIPGSTDGEGQKPPRLTITARGVALLAQCGCLPQVDKAEIEDKSKANDLAKATVILQATWMIVQVVGRLAFQLPVTLLEVNTVAHVLCAFVVYIFWWSKPLLPNEPIVLHDEGLAPLAAFMYSSSEISGYVNPERVRSQTWVKTLFAYLSVYSKSPEMENICLRAPFRKEGSGSSMSSAEAVENPENKRYAAVAQELGICMRADSGGFQRSSPACVGDIRARREKEKGTAFFERRPRIIDDLPAHKAGSAADLCDNKRWSLIQKAFQQHPSLFQNRVFMSHAVSGMRCVHLQPEQLLTDHVSNWPSSDLLRNVDGLVVGMVLWLANFCYGGIHAAAWNAHFPSAAEMWLWRVSSCYIGFCGGLWVILNFIVAQSPLLNQFWENWMDGKKVGWRAYVSVSLSLCAASCSCLPASSSSLRPLSALGNCQPWHIRRHSGPTYFLTCRFGFLNSNLWYLQGRFIENSC